MPRKDKVREALEAVLSAYDGYIDTDQLDKLAEAIGEARKTLAETPPPRALTPRQELANHLRKHHPRVKISTRDTFEDLGRKHGSDHHHYAPRNHYHRGRNTGPNDRPPGWKTGLDVMVRQTQKGY